MHPHSEKKNSIKDELSCHKPRYYQSWESYMKVSRPCQIWSHILKLHYWVKKLCGSKESCKFVVLHCSRPSKQEHILNTPEGPFHLILCSLTWCQHEKVRMLGCWWTGPSSQKRGRKALPLIIKADLREEQSKKELEAQNSHHRKLPSLDLHVSLRIQLETPTGKKVAKESCGGRQWSGLSEELEAILRAVKSSESASLWPSQMTPYLPHLHRWYQFLPATQSCALGKKKWLHSTELPLTPHLLVHHPGSLFFHIISEARNEMGNQPLPVIPAL